MKLRAVHALAASALFLVPPGGGEIHPHLEGVAFAGCAEVSGGPVCHLDGPTSLRLWWPGELDAPAAITVDGAPAAVVSDRVAGGRRAVIEVAPPARALALRVEREDGPRVFHLRLAPRPEEPSQLAEARRRKLRGDLQGAEAALAGLPLADPAIRGRALSVRARLALARGDGEAAALFRRAMDAHARSGQLSHLVRDAVALAFTLHKRGDLDGAERALDRAAPLLDLVPEHRTDVAYERAAIAFDAAAPSIALEGFEEAERAARRLGMDDARWMADEMRAACAMMLGRHLEAEELLARLDAEIDDEAPCVQAHLHATRAAIGLLRLEGGEVVTDPGAVVTAARRAASAFGARCPRPSSQADAEATLALLELRRGRTEAAAAAIARAREAAPHMSFELEGWVLDAEARLALARGHRVDAARRFRALRERAEALEDRESAWRAAWGEAESAEDEAARIAALVRAEAIVEAELTDVRLGEGRDTLSSRRGRTAAALVAAHLARGAPRDAFEAARRARVRALRSFVRRGRLSQLPPGRRGAWRRALGRYRRGRAELDARLADRWTVPERELAAFDAEVADRSRGLRRALDDAYRALGTAPEAAPETAPPGTLLWLAQRVEGGWALFAALDGAVRSVTRSAPPPVDPEALGEWAFAPFDDAVASAERVALLVPTALSSLDVHAAHWRGEPLVVRRDAFYALDLRSEADAAEGPTLLVIDPGGDLRGAREEHAVLARSLGDHALALFGDAADRAAVLRALAGASTLHFAGHASASGPRGWDGALELAGGTRLGPADVLAAAAVPETVLLSGCETARGDRAAGDVQSVGLAPAFLLAGSRTVMATSRPVSDEAAAALARALGPRVARGAVDREVMRSAITSLRGAHPDEWRAYHVLVAGLGGER